MSEGVAINNLSTSSHGAQTLVGAPSQICSSLMFSPAWYHYFYYYTVIRKKKIIFFRYDCDNIFPFSLKNCKHKVIPFMGVGGGMYTSMNKKRMQNLVCSVFSNLPENSV